MVTMSSVSKLMLTKVHKVSEKNVFIFHLTYAFSLQNTYNMTSFRCIQFSA